MPQFGRLPSAVAVAPAATGSAPELPWEIHGATIQMTTFEVDIDPALDLLPETLSRPAPPYARLLIASYPDSPIGAYCEALLLISCRYQMLPRQYLAASVVSSGAAREANLVNSRYLSNVGEVSLVRDGNSFTGSVRLASGLEIRATSANARATSPAVIRYDPTVVVADRGGAPGLWTVSAEPPSVAEAWLAPATTVEYSGGERTSPWLRLRSRNPITCTIAMQDVLIPAPKPVGAAPVVSAG
jgi:hypothetical protein